MSPFMAPSITRGAVSSSQRKAATKVSVCQVPNGTRPITRSPRRHRPERRAMVVVIEVSSVKTRQDVSSRACCRIQCRRARATSARSCSAARRVFFEADAVALEKPPQRAAAAGKPAPVQGRDEFLQRPVRMLADQSQDLVRVVLQRRSAPAAGLGRPAALPFPRLEPLDRRAGTDLKTFRRLTPRGSLL